MMHDGYGFGFGFGGVFMWLFWILLIVVVVLAVRGLTGGGSGPGSSAQERTPLQLLEERYARGEIDREEFEERRRTLTGE